MENLFQLRFTGQALWSAKAWVRYSAHRKMDNFTFRLLGTEPPPWKGLWKLPAVIRQPLALNKNILSQGTNSSIPYSGTTSTSSTPSLHHQPTAKPRSDSKQGKWGLVNSGWHCRLSVLFKESNARRETRSGFVWERCGLIDAAAGASSPNCRLLSRGCAGKCSGSCASHQIRPKIALPNGNRGGCL